MHEYNTYVIAIVFSTKMKIDMIPSYCYMKGVHLVENNIYFKIFKS